MARVKREGKTYFTGKPCPQGHVADRFTANGTCVECNDSAQKVWSSKNTEHLARKSRARNLLRHYSLTQDAFDALLAKQDGKCAICRTSTPPKYKTVRGNRGGWQVDHCHKNGHVRGILCGPCNRALGAFRDDVDRMSAAIRYLVLQ